MSVKEFNGFGGSEVFSGVITGFKVCSTMVASFDWC